MNCGRAGRESRNIRVRGGDRHGRRNRRLYNATGGEERKHTETLPSAAAAARLGDGF